MGPRADAAMRVSKAPWVRHRRQMIVLRHRLIQGASQRKWSFTCEVSQRYAAKSSPIPGQPDLAAVGQANVATLGRYVG